MTKFYEFCIIFIKKNDDGAKKVIKSCHGFIEMLARKREWNALRDTLYTRVAIVRLVSSSVTVTNDVLSIRIVRREGENGEHLLAPRTFVALYTPSFSFHPL